MTKKLRTLRFSGLGYREFKDNIFSRKLPVDSSKCLKLVLGVILGLRIQENLHCRKTRLKNLGRHTKKRKVKINNKSQVLTFMIFDPSSLYLMRLPTISAGWTISSRMASCTAVSVRVRGLWAAEPFLGGGTILLVAITTTSYMSTKGNIRKQTFYQKQK